MLCHCEKIVVQTVHLKLYYLVCLHWLVYLFVLRLQSHVHTTLYHTYKLCNCMLCILGLDWSLKLWYSSFLTSCLWAPNRECTPVFLMHSIETRMFNHSTRMFRQLTRMFNHSTHVFNHATHVFNHSTYMFKFVFDRHGFTSVRLNSNSSGMQCEYVTSSDSSIRVHTSLSCALLEQ